MTILLMGCAHVPQAGPKMLVTAPAPPATGSVDSKDAMPVPQVVVQLDVYQITVPHGTVSNNDSFWKNVSEENLDVVSRDVLYLNGLRVGEAPLSQWGFFQGLID